MQTDQIISLLIAERDRLSKAIDALRAPTNGAPAKSAPIAPTTNGAPNKRRISAAGRKRIAEAARRRWAAIRAAKANKEAFAKKP